MKTDKYGFTIVSNFEELEEAKKQGFVKVSIYSYLDDKFLIRDLDQAEIILSYNKKLIEK